MGKHWRIYPHDPVRISQLERSAGVPAVVAQLLLGRGIYEPGLARHFIEAKLSGLRDPDELPGATEAADLINDAIRSKRRVVVYGDYDADGMTATAILTRCLELLGGDFGYYVPHRLDEGYGLNDEALRKLKSRGTDVVVTVDCGVASPREAETAKEIGLELIVTDHHELSDELPSAAAIVHPRLPGSNYGFPGLCGAGVAFKLAWALCQRASQSKKVSPRLKEYLMTAMGLAAIGTVADVVPLLDENRLLVRHGLSSLKQRPSRGLAAMMSLTGLDKKPTLGSEDIAFVLAPRLNAAGRLGQAQLGIELLTTESAERASALAEYIDQLNGNRETLERSIYLSANKQVSERFDPKNDPALVLAGRGWHPGVIGIVAGRLAEKYCRPVVMIALDQLGQAVAKGSARSANGLNLHEALAACTGDLVAHGGHAAAAGLQIEEANIDRFRDRFCDYVSGEISDEDRVAEVRIDAETPLVQLTLKTVEQIEQLAPFGHANPRPVLCCTCVTRGGAPRRMGGGDRHLSVTFQQHGKSMRTVAFGKGEWAEQLEGVTLPLDIAFRPVINEFRGRRSVEMHLVDWRVSAPH